MKMSRVYIVKKNLYVHVEVHLYMFLYQLNLFLYNIRASYRIYSKAAYQLTWLQQ